MKKTVLVLFLAMNLAALFGSATAQEDSQWDIEFKNTFVPTERPGSDETIIDRDVVAHGAYPVIVSGDQMVSIAMHMRVTDRPIMERKGPASSAMIGIQFSPVPYVGFEGNVGFNTYTRKGRMRGAIWLGEMTSAQGGYFLFTEVESGGENGWYGRSNFRVNLADWIGVGALLESNTGAGPRFDFIIPQWPVSVYFSALAEWGAKKLKTENIYGLIGIQAVF